VANLLLARAEVRRSELAIRTALGAGPARLAGELLTESLVLAAAGTAAGFAIASAIPSVIRAIGPGALPRLDEAHVDLRVALFVVGLLLLSTLLFASPPLIERLRLRNVTAPMTGRGGGRHARSVRVSRALVVVQTALAAAVVITTVFLITTFLELQRTDLGFSTDNLLTARVALSQRYAGADASRFFDRAIDAVEQVSGVTGAAAITQLPLSGSMLGSTFQVEPGPEGRRIDADLRGVTPGYFGVMSTPILQGRGFTDGDTADTPAVAIVDESFARRLSPDGHVLGRRIRWIRQPAADIDIVGIVRAVRHRGPAEPVHETVYRPHTQYSRTSMFLAIRTAVAPAAVAPRVRAAVAAIDPSQPFADAVTMERRLDLTIGRARLSLVLASVLAALALALAVIGLYGLLSFGIAQRLREFGVRISLGATPGSVRLLVLKEGLALTCTGVGIGTAGAALVAAAIQSTLYGTNALDAREYALGAGCVLVASIVALWIPARRASRADPAVALRSE
jgi:putative ABC transport system permease protein